MSKKQKRRARIDWVGLAKKQKEARDLRGIYEVPADDKEYDKLISELKVKLAQPKTSCYACTGQAGGNLLRY